MKSLIPLLIALLSIQTLADPRFHLPRSKKGMIAICPGMPIPSTRETINNFTITFYNKNSTTFDAKSIFNSNKTIEDSFKSALAIVIKKGQEKNFLPQGELNLLKKNINSIDVNENSISFGVDIELSNSKEALYRMRVGYRTTVAADNSLSVVEPEVYVSDEEKVQFDLWLSLNTNVDVKFRNTTTIEYDLSKNLNNNDLLKTVLTQGVEFYNNAQKQEYEPKLGNITASNDGYLDMNEAVLYNANIEFNFKTRVVNEKKEVILVNINFEYKPASGKIVSQYVARDFTIIKNDGISA